MDIRTYLRGEDVQLTTHFHLREMECRCGECPTTLVSHHHMARLEELRERLGGHSVTITSGFRCGAHNLACGGHTNSQHCDGIATDIMARGCSPDEVADEAGALGFDGIGRYDTFTHLDSRGYRSRWDRRARK